MARIGVCLSGCGVNDGAEIHESVITALILDRAGAEIIYTAPDVKRIIQKMLATQKPLGFICIAPAFFARAIKNADMTAKITIGNDRVTADQIEKLESQHEICSVDDCIVDEENKIVSTPAYMLARNISEAATGIEKLVHQIMKWV